MAISHDVVVERAARVVPETNASVKIVGAKQSHETDARFTELIGTLSLVGKLGGTRVVYCQWQQGVRLAAGMLGEEGTEPESDDALAAGGGVRFAALALRALEPEATQRRSRSRSGQLRRVSLARMRIRRSTRMER
ncbi:MAG: hypothetical protein ABIR79_23640 [Candidatus Binatia bacterium]